MCPGISWSFLLLRIPSVDGQNPYVGLRLSVSFFKVHFGFTVVNRVHIDKSRCANYSLTGGIMAIAHTLALFKTESFLSKKCA